MINNYNGKVAGQATPAGQTLISKGLMTLEQLQALGGVAQPILPAPADQVERQLAEGLGHEGGVEAHLGKGSLSSRV